MNNERVAVIAGAAGFIGTHLSEKLITQEDYRVIGIDNMITGSADNVQYLLSRYSEFKFIEHDIKEPLNPQIRLMLYLTSLVQLVRRILTGLK